MKEFDKLVKIVKKLRSENGCEWDKKQDMESMKKYIIEEMYELIEAINENNIEEIKEEIGDIMMHMVFISRIAEEKCWFDIKTILENINKKLISRHPHVFGNKKVESVEEILKNWEELKKNQKKERKYLLDGIPKAMPPIRRSVKIQEKISRIGIDFKDIYSIINKINEELEEVKNSIKETNNKERIKEEIGDLFFTLIRLAMFLEIDPEDAMEATNLKVIKRFKIIEDKLREKDKKITDMSFEELNSIWAESK